MEPFQTTPNVIEARPVQLPSASGF